MSAPGPGRPAGRLVALVVVALLLALLDGVLCARASLGRTASWSFPIDDAYIYSNYVRALGAGRPFAYNYAYDSGADERSGGVTSAGWMLLLWAGQPLTALLGAAPGGIAPAAVRQAAPALAVTAGRLYLVAYGLGTILLAAAACACGWLAWELYRDRASRLAAALAVAAGGALLADQNAIWGSYSGLEVPLSLCLIALAPASLLYDLRRAPGTAPRLRASLLAAALLPWARPELAVVGVVAAAWLGALALRRRELRGPALAYGGAVLGGLAALAALYTAYTGRPLPSSFYAKVGGVQAGRAADALQEWVRGQDWQPFALLALALLGAVALGAARRAGRTDRRDTGTAPVGAASTVLVGGCAAAYFGAMLLALRWFGQEDRYILPIHALVLPLALGLPAVWAARPGPAAVLARLLGPPRRAAILAVAVGAGFLLVHVATLRVWAAGDYALFVQNIEDAHVAPALWLAAHAPPGTVLAAEPIGAVHLFGGHPTVDIVGLTTPAQLGHYGDWAATADLLHARSAGYLLFYPRWWPDGHALPWAHLLQRFTIPDNRIAGDNLIAVYGLTAP